MFPILPFDQNGVTTCATSPNQGVILAPGLHFDKYAIRNASSSSDCITVPGINPAGAPATPSLKVPALGIHSE